GPLRPCWGDWDVVLIVVDGLVLGRGAVTTGGVKPTMVKPVDIFQGGKFELIEATARTVTFHQLSLVQHVHRLAERVVIRISFTTNGNRHTRLDETFGVANRQVLTAPIRMVYELPVLDVALPQRHLQRLQRQVGAHVSGQPPPDDEPGEAVNDERGVDR